MMLESSLIDNIFHISDVSNILGYTVDIHNGIVSHVETVR